jgi:hypothetical protein
LLFEKHKLIFTDALSLKVQHGLDIYLVLEYPAAHDLHFVTELDKVQWLSVFGFSKRSINNQINPKGIIQLPTF